MSRSRQICPVCENSYLWGRERRCEACAEQERLKELETRMEVMALNDVDDLEGLKKWIKEHLIK